MKGYVYGNWSINNTSYGNLYKTIDGGAHWTKQHYKTAYNLRSLKFFDESNAIALNYSNPASYLMSTNNGGDWEKA